MWIPMVGVELSVLGTNLRRSCIKYAVLIPWQTPFCIYLHECLRRHWWMCCLSLLPGKFYLFQPAWIIWVLLWLGLHHAEFTLCWWVPNSAPTLQWLSSLTMYPCLQMLMNVLRAVLYVVILWDVSTLMEVTSVTAIQGSQRMMMGGAQVRCINLL